MARHRGFMVWCLVVLAVFGGAKEFGLDFWPFADGLYAVAWRAGGTGSGGGSGGFGTSGGGRSGSYSSSHK